MASVAPIATTMTTGSATTAIPAIVPRVREPVIAPIARINSSSSTQNAATMIAPSLSQESPKDAIVKSVAQVPDERLGISLNKFCTDSRAITYARNGK